MWNKIENYYWTLKYLKKSQLFYLLKNRLERGKKAKTAAVRPDGEPAPLGLWMDGLDACPDYLGRFDTEGILSGRVTLLYESGSPGGGRWAHPSRSHLWYFNLHYLEFLVPLAAAYRREKEPRYYERFREYCRSWIRDNADGTGDGWHPYTISLRLTNLWICLDGFGDVFREDRQFARELTDSMYAQYMHLRRHTERHLLGNHYLENLKAILLGAVFFQEAETYSCYKKKLRRELGEQILADGVHYERSLMYHKLILEDLMRVAKAVRCPDEAFYKELLRILKEMADAAWSLESGLGRTPLFNDAGDNVAKPLEHCLLAALEAEFGICPQAEKRSAFPQAGYYCLENERIKILLDAGEMAPAYMPGHGHCDGLSFELGLDQRPFFVNSGTGQYQGELRSYFRSTAAHNTVVLGGEEQSVCWGEHRVGRRMRLVSGGCRGRWAAGSLVTCTGRHLSRRIGLRDHTVVIRDRAEGPAAAYLHLAPEYEYEQSGPLVRVLNQKGEEMCRIRTGPKDRLRIFREGTICSYAPEFGRIRRIQVLQIAWEGKDAEHEIRIQFQKGGII